MKLPALAVIATMGASFAFAAQTVEPGAVKIVDGELAMSLTGVAGDPANGRKAAADRGRGNCMTCHPITDMSDLPFHGDLAPTLDGVAGRYTEAQLRAIVVNSKEVFGPDTFMPAMYKVDGLKTVAKKYEGAPILTAQEVEDVVAYLLTLKE